MRNLLLAISFVCISGALMAQQNLGINTASPDPSAVVDMTSTSKGLLIPRMTSSQRDAVSSPAQGLLIYSTTDSSFYVFIGIAWSPLNTTYSAGTGIAVAENVITNTGDTDATNDITNTTAAGGDLNGTYPNPTVDALQGTGIAPTAPTSGQVLKYDGTQWSPSSDNNSGGTVTSVATGTGLTGGTITSTGTIALANGTVSGQIFVTGSSPFTPTLQTMSGDVAISTTGVATVQDNSVDGTDIVIGSDATGDVMYYDGSDWTKLSAGSNGSVLKLASGIPSWGTDNTGGGIVNSELSSSTSTSTTSSSFSTISGITSTPAAGTYMVTFSCTADNSNGSIDMTIGIHKAGTLIAASQRVDSGTEAYKEFVFSTQALVTVNGSEVIDVQYKTALGTFFIVERSMILVKVSN